MKTFSNLAFSNETAEYLNRILRSYILYHLDIADMKSESYITFDE